MSVHQKLDIIMENKAVQKIKKKLKKNDWFLTWKIDFESTILALFDKA